MSKLAFDETGKHFYENGIENVVLFVAADSGETGSHNGFRKGVAWNGVTALTESPQGADANPLYADDIKYLNLIANETFNATIEAYSSPVQFDECDGTAKLGGLIAKIGQQARRKFCLAYKTLSGDDNDGKYEKWHIIYNCKAAPSSKDYSTVNDSPEAAPLSWEISTVPLSETEAETNNEKYAGVCTVTIDKRCLNNDTKWQDLEDHIIGKDGTTDGYDSQLLLPDEIYDLIKSTT